MAKVWADSQHAASDLLMLLAIADFADDDGNAYPAVGTLAAKCRMKNRNANYVLRTLERSGELQIMVNEGPRGTNRYRIVLESLGVQRGAGVQSSAGVQSLVATPAILGIKPLQPIADEPSLNHQEPPVVASLSISDQEKTADQEKPIKKLVRKKVQQSFKTWYEAAKAKNEKVIRADDPIHAYAKSVGLDIDFLNLQFTWFKEKYLNDPKLQADWIAVFRNSVRNCWGKLWFRTSDGVWKLTTVGKQAALAHGFDENMTSGGRDPWAGSI